jgi:hypothetical protein
LADWPRPFVFRASHLDGRVVPPGQRFWFDVHLFDPQDPALAYFVLAFAELARTGLGAHRGRAALSSVEQLDLSGETVWQVYDGRTFLLRETPAPSQVDLRPQPNGPTPRVVVKFVTPTELKAGHEVIRRPEFGALFGRLRDRLSTLRALYGPGPLEIDFREMGERAARVKLARWQWRHEHIDRLSGKSRQVHPLGGFVGEAEYEGDLGEFLPYLRAARWVGVGRQTSWGKGEVEAQVL